MKKSNAILRIIVTAVVFLAATVWGAPPDASWLTDLGKAHERAKDENKQLLIVASMVGCGPCKQMSETTWRDGEIKELIGKNFVPCYLLSGSDEIEEWMDNNDIVAFPTVLVFTVDDKELMRSAGYIAPNDMYTMLAKLSTPNASKKKADSSAEKKKADEDKTTEKTDAKTVEKKESEKSDKTEKSVAASTEKKTPEKKTDEKKTTRESEVKRTAKASNVGEMMEESLYPQGIKPPRPSSYVRFEKPTLRQRAADRTEKVFRGIGRGVKDFGRGLFGRGNRDGGGADGDPTQVLSVLQSIGQPVAPENKKPDVVIKVTSTPDSMKKMPKVSEEKADTPTLKAKEKASEGDDEKKTKSTAKEETVVEKVSASEEDQTSRTKQEATPKLNIEQIKADYKEALALTKKGYNKNALALCEKIVRTDINNKSGVADMAYIMVASLTVSENDEVLRAKAYKMLVEFEARYPKSPNRDYYTVVRASLARGLGKEKEANLLLRNFPKEFPNSKRKAMAHKEWVKLTGQQPPTKSEVQEAKSSTRRNK